MPASLVETDAAPAPELVSTGCLMPCPSEQAAICDRGSAAGRAARPARRPVLARRRVDLRRTLDVERADDVQVHPARSEEVARMVHDVARRDVDRLLELEHGRRPRDAEQ